MISLFKTHRGFTLIETIVASFVLVLAITGPMTIYWRFLRDSSELKNTLIAQYLAQEGIELLANKIYRQLDANHQGADGFLSGTAACSSGASRWCGVDYNTPGITSVDVRCEVTTENCRLWTNPSGVPYYHHVSAAGDIRSPFIRRLRVELIARGGTRGQVLTDYARLFDPGHAFVTDVRDFEEIRLTSFVTWTDHGRNKSTQLNFSILNRL